MMWSKTLERTSEAVVQAAADALDESAEKILTNAAATATDVLEPLRDDVREAAVLIACGAAFLGLCVLLAAAVVTR